MRDYISPMDEMSRQNPIVVLVETQMGENIGMCARAMLNCGLTELRLVNPRDGWPNQRAVGPAAGAAYALEQVQCFSSLDEALADVNFVLATSARTRHMNLPALTLSEAVEQVHSHARSNVENRSAILFGPEASGMDNTTLSRADRLVNYSMNPDYSSLNLAQAVLVFSWQWWSTRDGALQSLTDEFQPADKNQLTDFYDRLERELEKGGYFPNELKRPNTMQKLRTLFNRANPTEQELRGLHGMITALGQKVKDT